VWDADLKGFGLLVLPSGVKSYVFNHRTPEGRERRATIGKHGSVTPDQARDKAEQLRLAVSAGRDPLGEKQERRTAQRSATCWTPTSLQSGSPPRRLRRKRSTGGESSGT
jgi:Arm domain-containing DNA-binding protein